MTWKLTKWNEFTTWFVRYLRVLLFVWWNASSEWIHTNWYHTFWIMVWTISKVRNDWSMECCEYNWADYYKGWINEQDNNLVKSAIFLLFSVDKGCSTVSISFLRFDAILIGQMSGSETNILIFEIRSITMPLRFPW